MNCSRLTEISMMQKPLVLTAVFLLAGGTYGSWAADIDQVGNKLDIALGKSRMVDLKEPVSRVAVGNPAVADVKILDRKQIWILGMGIGSTNLMLWDKAGNTIAAFDINVNLNVEQLNEEIRKLVKDGNVQVRSVRDRVVLEGRVPDQDTAASVVEFVQVFGHKNIVNLLKVDTRPPVSTGKPVEVEQVEIIRGTDMSIKQFKSQ